MKMKVIAGFAFLLNTLLFATYYAVAKEALDRIDPIVFTFFEMTTLAPVALCILALTWQQITWRLVKHGMLLGSILCLALFTISIALKYSTATGTAFFPALNGFLAALVAWFVFRQPLNKATWLAGILSLVGTGLLIANSQMGGIRGAVIAFLGGLFFTSYIFLSDHTQKGEHKEMAHWPLFGVELLTMAIWACLVALLFGDWQAVHLSLPKDVFIIVYISGACTFLPTLIAVLMQKHISPITISFIYILEPVLSAVMATIYLHEVLALAAYIGGGLVVIGAIIHTWSSEKQSRNAVRPAQSSSSQGQHVRRRQQSSTSMFGSFFYPALYCCAGVCILSWLGGGFPPLAWRELYQFTPMLMDTLQQGHLTGIPSLLNTLHQEGTQDGSLLFLLVQASCWLIAWVALVLIAYVTLLRTMHESIVRKGDSRKRAIALTETVMLASVQNIQKQNVPRVPIVEKHRLRSIKNIQPVLTTNIPKQEELRNAHRHKAYSQRPTHAEMIEYVD